jgi:CheY-like chemotaxis protein
VAVAGTDLIIDGLWVAAMPGSGTREYREVVPLSCVIVDDSPDFLRIASGLLEQEGLHVVAVATTGEEAMQAVRRFRPDVVLVDIELAGESGLDLVRQIASADGGAPRSILISTHSGDDFAELIEGSPALGFLPKAELGADAIRALLENSG